MDSNIAIIGAGNLGRSIADGLIASHTPPSSIFLTRRQTALLQPWQQQGVQVSSDNRQAVAQSRIVIVAVKPYQFTEVVSAFRDLLRPDHHILISVVTGISLAEMAEVAGLRLPLFRAMPNTAIAVRESMTCISQLHATEAQAEEVGRIFSELGRVAFIQDNLMDAATVLGACGTAYALRYIRANIQGGIEIGFDAATASLIAAQTVKGATELLLRNGSHPEQEIDKVTTPRGCTIAGLNEMEHQGFSSSLIKGISTSFLRITGKG